jgi:hypothetical protein
MTEETAVLPSLDHFDMDTFQRFNVGSFLFVCQHLLFVAVFTNHLMTHFYSATLFCEIWTISNQLNHHYA